MENMARQSGDCLYILRAADSVTLLVLVYVDDMAVAGRSLIVKWQNTTWSWSRVPELTEGTWLQLMCYAPSQSHCPKFQGNRVHGVYKDILEYTGGDREDRVD